LEKVAWADQKMGRFRAAAIRIIRDLHDLDAQISIAASDSVELTVSGC